MDAPASRWLYRITGALGLLLLDYMLYNATFPDDDVVGRIQLVPGTVYICLYLAIGAWIGDEAWKRRLFRRP